MSIDQSNLALIYSKLAVFENSTESAEDLLQNLGTKFTADKLTSSSQQSIEEAFDQVSAGLYTASSASDGRETVVINRDAALRVKELIETEKKRVSENDRLVKGKVDVLRKVLKEYDEQNANVFRARQETDTLNAKCKTLGQLCRSLQNLAKEKEANDVKILETEKESTARIDKECKQSVEGIQAKIAAEEADLDKMEAENTELEQKLSQFKQHLQLRREKRKNEERTKQLMAQLEEAQDAQRRFQLQQREHKRNALQLQIATTTEGISQLNEQLTLYAEKFKEFEDTLERSTVVLGKLEEQQTSLQTKVITLQQECEEWKGKVGQADLNLIQAVDQRDTTAAEVSAIKTALQKLEKKCRKLQARRKEMLSMQASQNAATGSASSSSSGGSSRTNAAPVGGVTASGRGDEAGAVGGIGVDSAEEAARARTVQLDGKSFRTVTPPAADDSVGTVAGMGMDPVDIMEAVAAIGGIVGSNQEVALQGKKQQKQKKVEVLSSSSSPARAHSHNSCEEMLVGEGSPVSSPTTSRGKAI